MWVMISFALIMIVTYLLIASEKVNKALIAVIGAAVTLVLAYVVYFVEGVEIFTGKKVLGELIDWEAIIIVLSLLVIVEVSKSSGILNFLTVKIIKLTKGDITKLLVYTNLLTYSLAMILNDEAAFLIVSSVTLVLVKNMRLDPVPFLYSEYISANAASCASLTSSVTNIIIASNYSFAPEYYLTYPRFLLIAFPFSFLIFVLNLFIFRWLARDRFVCIEECLEESELEGLLGLSEYEVVKRPSYIGRFVVLFIGLIIGFVVAGITGIPFFLVTLTGAIFFVIFSGELANVDKIIKRIDWNMIILFFGIFIVVGGVASVGLLTLVGEALAGSVGGNNALIWLILIFIGGALAGFVDGVSVTIILLNVIPSIAGIMGITNLAPLVWSVILGVDLGEIIAPIGGITSVLIFLMFKKEKIKFSFLDFMRLGTILTGINFTLAFLYILLLSGLLGW